VPHADPLGLYRVFERVEQDKLPVEEKIIAEALRKEMDPWALAAGARAFDLNLATGVLRLAEQGPGETSGANEGRGNFNSRFSGALDLSRLRLDQQVAIALEDLPKNWVGTPPSITLIFAGPIAKPDRRFDVVRFTDALAVRALARETARLENYEYDLRERAFFRERLRSERRREQERLKAEEEARRALEAEQRAAEQKKREEAMQEEMQRKAEEALRNAAPLPPVRPLAKPLPDTPSFFAPDPAAAGRY
jgi:hypothetical protein